MVASLGSLLIPLFLFAWQVNAQGVYTQFDVQEWPAGSVVLVNGDSVHGVIQYHYNDGVINVVKEDGTVSSYSPVNVHHFIAKNKYTGSMQVFRTFYWDTDKGQSGFKKPVFFEQLNHGDLTLIMREAYVPRYKSGIDPPGQYGNINDPYSYNKGIHTDVVKASYFIVKPDGDIIRLKKVSKDLLQLFGNKADQVERYVKKNNFSYDKKDQLIKIVNYYNSL